MPPRKTRGTASPWLTFQLTTENVAPMRVARKRAYPVVLDAPTVIEHTIMKDRSPHSPRQRMYVSRVSDMKANMAQSVAPMPTLTPNRTK